MKKTVSFEKDLNFQTMIGEVSSISLDDDLKFIDSSNVVGKFIVSGKYKMTEASRLEEDFSFDIPIEISLMETYDLDTTKIQITDFTYEIVDDDTLRCKIDVLLEGLEEISTMDDDGLEDNDVEVTVIDVEDDSIESEDVEGTDVILEDVALERGSDVNGEGECDEERDCDGEMKEEKDIPTKSTMNEKVDSVKNQEDLLDAKIESVDKQEDNLDNKVEAVVNQEIDFQDNISNVISNTMGTSSSKNSGNIVSKNVGSLFSNLADDDDTFKTYSIHIMREGDNLENIIERYKVSKEDLENYNDLSSVQINSKVIIPTDLDEE
ncbi:MAG: hypothetical protein J6B89_01850 [Bacilli bacterium]|nr:hypothetical protein [Bacilli bacterium]